MRHLNSGAIRLFNIRTDYREQHDLSTELHEKAAKMDAIRLQYVEEVEGGSIEEVRQALYDRMDEFSRRSREGFENKLARLQEQNPPDFEKRKAALLKELNEKLIKNEINKEKCRRFASYSSWRESPAKSRAAHRWCEEGA